MPHPQFNSALSSDVTTAPAARAASGSPMFVLHSDLTVPTSLDPWAVEAGSGGSGHDDVREVTVPEEYAWLNLYVVSRQDTTLDTPPNVIVCGHLPLPGGKRGGKTIRAYPQDDDSGFPVLPDNKAWVPLTPGFTEAEQAGPGPVITLATEPVIDYGANSDYQVGPLAARIYVQGVKSVLTLVETEAVIAAISTSTTTDAGSHIMLVGQFSG